MPDFELNFNNDDYSIIATTSEAIGENAFGAQVDDYIRVKILDQNNNSVGTFYSGSVSTDIVVPGSVSGYTTISGTHFESYRDPTNNLYIKPNEILSDNGLPQGNYKLQVDFLNQYQPVSNDVFVLKQISPSRLEVRLKLLDTNITKDSVEMGTFKTHLNYDTITDAVTDKYQFNHILYTANGNNIPIVNYTFDKFTDGEANQSIILRLYEPLPTSITKLSVVTVEREVLITQTQDVYYMSSVTSGQGNTGLVIDDSNTWTNQQGSNDTTWQAYDNLTGSLSDLTTINSLITGSSFDYPNLNIDYNSFSNHTFFGSAVKKLENFKTKVSTIEDYYSDISSSLYADGGAIDGDSEYLVSRRKKLFNDIQNELNSLTPYEKFLYNDGQSQTTSSAPSLGDNYADTLPVNPNDLTILPNYDGFNTVYKHTNEDSPDQLMRLFTSKYHVQNKPFFNYSSSIYLSFILKGDETVGNVTNGTRGLTWDASTSQKTSHNELEVPLPRKALYINKQEDPSITGSEYRRFIYQASQSYWIPNEGIDFNALTITTNGLVDASEVTILSGNIKTGSYQIQDSTGKYPTTVVSQSGVPFYGACMPAGELFRVYWQNPLAAPITSSYITDVKITFNDPTDTLPFAQVPKTDSSTWTDWYNTIYSQAETFDDENIHSLNNNIPTYIQESSEYDDLKTFLNMNGEHYDLIRNHIDNYTSIYNRGYNELDSVPKNLMPILADNLGWELITPFTGSLAATFGSSVSSTTTEDDITHNTWRKSLNNLIYLYKSKGTKNAIKALLNIYGYPSDIIGVSEYGGSTEEQNPSNITDDFNAMVGGMTRRTGSVSFINRRKKLYNYILNSKSERVLNLDWWTDNADANTIEFIYKHKKTTNTQEILTSSGSGALIATGSITILTDDTSDYDGKILSISSSDGTGKTYIFDDDNDGATGTLDGSGRVRIQIAGFTTSDAIANEVSTSISSTNGHAGKIEVSDSIQFITNNGLSFITSDGDTFYVNSSGSIVLTQLTASEGGNEEIITTAPSASVVGFMGGSDAQALWDLKVIPSSDGLSSSFAFKLNTTSHGSASIDSNALSMSTVYNRMTDGQLWNVMLQRMTSSISGSGTNEYKLALAYQKGDKIPTLSTVSMSVSGGLTRDTNYFANQNWSSTGSRGTDSSSNLYVGRTFSGSLAEIRTWTTTLSASKFKQHTLNKFSVVGHNTKSHKKELIYHFRLNENHSSASLNGATTATISDANPNGPFTNPTDYSFTISSDIVSGSVLYGYDFIDTYQLTVRTDSYNQENDNNIIINPEKSFTGHNLNPFRPSTLPLSDTSKGRAKKLNSSKLEIGSSPTNFINDFIINNIADMDILKIYTKPSDRYKASYIDLDTFRNDFFENYNITIDTNKFIRAHENIWNQSVISAIQNLVPARSTLSDSSVGVTIKPHLLEHQKVEHEKQKIQYGETGLFSSELTGKTADLSKEIDIKSHISILETYEASKDTTIDINEKTSLSESSYELSKDGKINIDTLITETLTVETSNDAEIDIDNQITKEATYEATKDVEININNEITKEATYEATKDIEINIDDEITKEASYEPTKDVEINIDELVTITQEMEHAVTRNINISMIPTTDSSIVTPITGSSDVDYHSTNWNKTFRNLHNEWGTGIEDTHFLNMAAGNESGSLGDYNIGHIEDRFVFRMVGDVEVMSSSFKSPSGYNPNHHVDFTDSNIFLNREMGDQGKGYTYKSYIGPNDGPQDGRPVGKTAYFSSSAGGAILHIPSNHYSKFSYPFKDTMYKGTQNTNPGFFNLPNVEDYSSASFYSVKVAFESGIKVVRGKLEKGSDNKLK